MPDWIWSYFFFLTDYSRRTIDNVPRAIKNLVKATVIQLNAGAQTPDPYAEQAIRRFKLDVIQDEDALAGASTDRVRETFRALVRSFELRDDEDEWPAPTKYKVCLVLDAERVELLADMGIDGDYREDMKRFMDTRVQVVDIQWKPSESTEDYRGYRYLSITALRHMYDSLTGNGIVLEEYAG